jgi:hypothetical protein
MGKDFSLIRQRSILRQDDKRNSFSVNIPPGEVRIIKITTDNGSRTLMGAQVP